MDMRGFRVFYVDVFLLLLQGCDGRSDSSPSVLGENNEVVLQAEAGLDLAASEGDIVELDGGFSVNQALIRSYFWSQTSGPMASLTNANGPKVSFSAPDVSEFSLLTFCLTVTDQQGGSDSDDVSVAVYPIPTTAFGLESRPSNPTCLATQSPPKKPVPKGISLKQVFTSLSFNFPLLMLQAPGNDSRWYVVERRGLIKTFKSRDTHSTVFANLSGRLTAPAHQLSEQGLLGMAFPGKFIRDERLCVPGGAVPGLQGTYLYADFGSGQIWGLPARLNTTPKPLLSSGLSIASFVQDNQGELYVD